VLFCDGFFILRAQANRASAETPQSRSQSPASQQAREGGPPQSEILANMAAMQQTNFTNAMAMAGLFVEQKVHLSSSFVVCYLLFSQRNELVASFFRETFVAFCCAPQTIMYA